MLQPSTLRNRYASKEPRLLLTLTTVVTFLHGIVIALRFFLRDQNAHSLDLSVVEWAAYTVGPFLIDPVLLFGVLYYVGTRCDRLPSLPILLPGLLGAVLVGTFLGQFVGEELFVTGWTPLAQAEIEVLFTPDLRTLPYWRDLIEPPIRSLLSALAAVALAKSSAE